VPGCPISTDAHKIPRKFSGDRAGRVWVSEYKNNETSCPAQKKAQHANNLSCQNLAIKILDLVIQ